MRSVYESIMAGLMETIEVPKLHGDAYKSCNMDIIEALQFALKYLLK